MYISFSHPLYLVFLFVIPILIFLHFFSLKSRRRDSLKFANFDAIARVKGIDLYSKNIWKLSVDILFVVMLVFALAGLTLHNEVDASSFSFVIAIDGSQSMTATDMKPNRLSVAKETSIDFVNGLPFETYVGVLSFSGESIVEQELTKDNLLLKTAIEGIEINMVGGTDIYDAVLNSVKMLRGERNKAIILLSDGQVNVGSIQDTIDYARDYGVMIHTIGIGSVEGGEVSYGMSKLDEDSLMSLAHNTDGSYFNVLDKEGLEKSFGEIVGVTQKLAEIELGLYLLMVVVVLFVVRQFWGGMSRMGW